MADEKDLELNELNDTEDAPPEGGDDPGQAEAPPPMEMGGGLPYSESPGLGRVGQTANALQAMARRTGATSGGYGPLQSQLLQQDVMGGTPSAKRELALQEPGRIGQLLQTLLGTYKTGVGLSAEQVLQLARMSMLLTEKRKAKAELFGKTPVVGGILAYTGA